MVETIWQDLKYGLRNLRNSPGFFFLASATLALGIGANVDIFSVVNAILIRPLPYNDPDSLIQVKKHMDPFGPIPERLTHYINYREFLVWPDNNRSLEYIAGHEYGQANLSGGESTHRVEVAKVSQAFLPLLGIVPALGSNFSPEEDRAGGQFVAILSNGLWQRLYGGNPEIVGETIWLNSKPYLIVGVLPPSFRSPTRSQADLYTPLAQEEYFHLANRRTIIQVIGKLKPNVSLAQAQTDLDSLFQETLRRGRTGHIVLTGLHDQIVSDVRSTRLIFLGAIGFVLMVACSNVANLLLARAISRKKEMAIRLAIGASKGRIIRQLLTESVLLALLGSVAGLGLAIWLKDLIQAGVAENLEEFISVEIDPFVLGFTVLLLLATGIIFGLAPALQASNANLAESIKEGSGPATEGRQRNKLRRGLVISEVAIALVLMIGAGLLIKSFYKLQKVDLGIRLDQVLTLKIQLTQSQYPDSQSQSKYFEMLLQRLHTLPDVESVCVSAGMPLVGPFLTVMGDIVEGREPQDQDPSTSITVVSSDYFRTLNIPLLHGRTFTERDRQGAVPVAVINDEFARYYFPDQDPIGRRVKNVQREWMEIVGIVRGVRVFGPEEKIEPQVYGSYLQSGSPFMTLAIRTRNNPMDIVSSIRSIAQSMDKDQPIYDIMSLEQHLSDHLLPRRVRMLLLLSSAVLALVLACIGTYGVISYSVSRRTHELGIRMALGAYPRQIFQLVIREGLALSFAGATIGFVLSYWLTQYLSSLLFEVEPFDLMTFVVIAVLLTAVVQLSFYIPARRAARVDPATALHYE